MDGYGNNTEYNAARTGETAINRKNPSYAEGSRYGSDDYGKPVSETSPYSARVYRRGDYPDTPYNEERPHLGGMNEDGIYSVNRNAVRRQQALDPAADHAETLPLGGRQEHEARPTGRAQNLGGVFGQPVAGAGNSENNFGKPANTARNFGGAFGQPASEPRNSGGEFGQATSDPRNSGGAFGQATSDPRNSGGAFGQATSDPRNSGGAFGQPASESGNYGREFEQPVGKEPGVGNDIGQPAAEARRPEEDFAHPISEPERPADNRKSSVDTSSGIAGSLVNMDDDLVSRIDEFRARAQELQRLMQTREQKAQELENIVAERSSKADELEQIVQERQEQADGMTAAVARQVNVMTERVTERLAAIQSSLGGSQAENQQLVERLDRLQMYMEQEQKEKQQLAEQLDKIQASVGGNLMESQKVNEEYTEQVQTTLNKVGEQLDTMKSDIADKVHSESVKSYRNVQDLFKDMDERLDRVDDVEQDVKALHGFSKIIIGVVAVNLVGIIVVLLGTLGVF